MEKLTCFKAYDVRGKLGEELNETVAYRIGRAFAQVIQPKTVVVGGDVRETSEALKLALVKGLQDGGVNVLDIGLSGTEEIYFATFYKNLDGGIEVTASHNPIEYNGMKFVGKNAAPIGRENGFTEIQALAECQDFIEVEQSGSYQTISIIDEYVNYLLGFIDVNKLNPLKIVANSGNGVAGHVIDAIEAIFKAKNIPVELIKLHHQPDSRFPHGIPNPLLPENRQDTINAVREYNADIGLAWDGDFDRCFFFDGTGRFIEGYYIVGLLAESFLQEKSEKIIYDPRLTWNTEDIVRQNGGQAIMSKTGHVFIKENMRKEDAIYGGEMSAHHYFRDFSYCDSGMIPWLKMIELMSIRAQSLQSLVDARMAAFPCSGEINFTVKNAKSILQVIEKRYQTEAQKLEYIDGLSADCGEWRFNIRVSNTEPLLRLNVETRANQTLLDEKIAELTAIIEKGENAC